MLPRRLGRIIALKSLYLFDICADFDLALKYIKNDNKLNEKVVEFAEYLVKGTINNKNIIDKLISEHSKNWVLDRMPSVDRNILRLATFELLKMEETPISVIINEGIEIAKLYSGIESGKFVNGVLDKIKTIRNKNQKENGCKRN